MRRAATRLLFQVQQLGNKGDFAPVVTAAIAKLPAAVRDRLQVHAPSRAKLCSVAVLQCCADADVVPAVRWGCALCLMVRKLVWCACLWECARAGACRRGMTPSCLSLAPCFDPPPLPTLPSCACRTSWTSWRWRRRRVRAWQRPWLRLRHSSSSSSRRRARASARARAARHTGACRCAGIPPAPPHSHTATRLLSRCCPVPNAALVPVGCAFLLPSPPPSSLASTHPLATRPRHLRTWGTTTTVAAAASKDVGAAVAVPKPAPSLPCDPVRLVARSGACAYARVAPRCAMTS